MKTITKEEAKNWIEEAIQNDVVFGLRGDDFIPEVNFEDSCIWEDGHKSKDELNGLCAMQITNPENIDWSFEEIKKYGVNFFLIVGESYEEGNDEWAHEIIISNHRIFAQIID